MHTLIDRNLHYVVNCISVYLVIIYTCIYTFLYGNLVIGKHSCFCNMLSNTFVNMCICMYSCCSINRVVLYLVFIAVVKLLIKPITVFRDATFSCQTFDVKEWNKHNHACQFTYLYGVISIILYKVLPQVCMKNTARGECWVVNVT